MTNQYYCTREFRIFRVRNKETILEIIESKLRRTISREEFEEKHSRLARKLSLKESKENLAKQVALKDQCREIEAEFDSVVFDCSFRYGMELFENYKRLATLLGQKDASLYPKFNRVC